MRSEHVRSTTTWATSSMAVGVVDWTSGSGRLRESIADQGVAMVALTEAASEPKVKRDGKHVDFDVAIPEGELRESIAALLVEFQIY